MPMFSKIRLLVAIVLLVIAAAFLITGAYYFVEYLIYAENRLIHEYLIGTWLGLIYATGFSIGSAFFAITVKKDISKSLFYTLSIPGLILGIGLFLIYLGSLAYDLAAGR